MYKIVLWILFLTLNINVFGQYSPEIEKRIEEVRTASYADSARLFKSGETFISYLKKNNLDSIIPEVYILYGNQYFYKRHFAPATEYYNKALNTSKSLINKHTEVLSKIRINYIQFENGNLEEAEVELNSLLMLAKEIRDFRNEAEILNVLGLIKEAKSDPKAAIKLYFEGLHLALANKSDYYAAVFWNNIGLIKLDNGQKNEALLNFEEAIRLSSKINNSRLKGHIQMNICMIKVADNDPESAKKLFTEVIKYSKENKLPQELASNYINLSSAFTNAGRHDEAILYLDSGINVLKGYDLKEALTAAYLAKANVFIADKNYPNALASLKDAKQIIDKTKLLENQVTYYKLNYDIHSAQKNYKNALEEFLMYSKLNDSLNQQLNTKIVNELQQGFEVKRKEIELEREKAKSQLLLESNKNERIYKWIAVASGIFIIIILLLLLNNRYVRKLREKQEDFSRELIKNIDEERKRIAIDLHDDIGQSLSVIKSKVIKEQNSSGIKNLNIEKDLSNVIEQTREISKNLFPSNIEKIGLTRSMALLFEQIQMSTNLICSFEIDESIELLSPEQKTQLFRIIQECSNNTIKHSGATGMKVQLFPTETGYSLIYQDNGKGFNFRRESKGIGLKSLKERAKILNGIIDFGDDKNLKGFKLIIKFRDYSLNKL